MSANVLIVLSGLRSEPNRRELAHWLIWLPARSIARLIVAALEYRLQRPTQQFLSALDDRKLADVGLRRNEIDTAIDERGRQRLLYHDAMPWTETVS
jgi:uncharacterized protein YjiS (DUF1127 family)